jgi:hypothetical protein
MKLKAKLVAGLASVLLAMSASAPAMAYPAGSGDVGTLWGTVTGFQSKILVTVRGVATEADSEIQVSVTNPKGFTRKLTAVSTSTNSDGEFRFRVGGLKWTAGTYKVSVKSGSVKQDLAVFVSSKRVRG